MRFLTAGLAMIGCAMAADKRPISPATIKPIGPYSPGILTRDFLYVSGQGAKNAQGQIPPDLDGQLRQCFENVKAVVDGAGLTMDHVVYTQVYLTDPTDEGPLNRVWKEYFPKSPPARSTIGVALLPATPVEMSAVAVRDLARKKTVAPPGYPASSPLSPGVIAGDRLYLSGFLGRDINTGNIPEDPAAQVELSLDRMQATLKAAGLDFGHMVFVNPYLTGKIPTGVMNRIYATRFEFGNTPARATIQVAGLPSGANIEFAGVAVMDLSKRRAVRPKNMDPSPTASPCVFAGDTLFCSAKSGFIPGVNGGIYAGTVETQVRQTMRNLLDGLEEAGMNFSNVVASNVYLDNLDEFTPMNGVYAEYFPTEPPARTTVQQLVPGKRQADARGRWPTLEQISMIAVR
ncbi:MAG TPA: RidA family protein [Candidatus Acidoferrales bacterium]|nr:RidA family protein [Candidatus Acidoferrales bacterium]